ncbi:CG13650 [Drosophila busckii]|uniref:CG13650 n=1 Tax=Drosophila busckii TaxID=30019 RepID=A0A0M4F712_DROBS|nr:CG13650 [Drosophila busckii]
MTTEFSSRNTFRKNGITGLSNNSRNVITSANPSGGSSAALLQKQLSFKTPIGSSQFVKPDEIEMIDCSNSENLAGRYNKNNIIGWICCAPCIWLRTSAAVHKMAITSATLLVTTLLVASPILFLISTAPSPLPRDCFMEGDTCLPTSSAPPECTEAICETVSANIQARLNWNKDPCSEFKKFSCWQSTTNQSNTNLIDMGSSQKSVDIQMQGLSYAQKVSEKETIFEFIKELNKLQVEQSRRGFWDSSVLYNITSLQTMYPVLNWTLLIPKNWSGPIVVRNADYLRALQAFLTKYPSRVAHNSMLLLSTLEILPRDYPNVEVCTRSTIWALPDLASALYIAQHYSDDSKDIIKRADIIFKSLKAHLKRAPSLKGAALVKLSALKIQSQTWEGFTNITKILKTLDSLQINSDSWLENILEIYKKNKLVPSTLVNSESSLHNAWAYPIVSTIFYDTLSHSIGMARLPGLNLTPTQIFFLVSAQELCAESKYMGIDTSASEFDNILGWLIAQGGSATEVFKCPSGSMINIQKTCNVL